MQLHEAARPRLSSRSIMTNITGQVEFEQLGIGIAHTPPTPTADSLTSALEQALQPDLTARAQTIAAAMRSDGTLVAARRLMDAA